MHSLEILVEMPPVGPHLGALRLRHRHRQLAKIPLFFQVLSLLPLALKSRASATPFSTDCRHNLRASRLTYCDCHVCYHFSDMPSSLSGLLRRRPSGFGG